MNSRVDNANIFGNKVRKGLAPVKLVPKAPTPSRLVEIPWVQLPAHVQAHIRSHVHEALPGIKDLAYFWNRHLTDDGRMSVLKQAGVD